MDRQKHYYNEIDPFAAEWLHNLMDAGEIPAGDVDTRSIKDVQPDDLDGYIQCHFFAGVGGWCYALRLAGWPDDVPIWTGSCPCQPFSDAGDGLEEQDPRHLWPDFRRLIAARKPSVAVGEQVASKKGRRWLSGVRADLEALGHGFGAADLCAPWVAAPHLRQRLYWVADRNGERLSIGEESHGCEKQPGRQASRRADARGRRAAVGMVDGEFSRLEGLRGYEYGGSEPGRFDADQDGSVATSGFWDRCRVVRCRDDKRRRIPLPESGVFPMAHGIPVGMGRGRPKAERVAISAARTNRVGRLKGYGNAIVPELAVEFIRAYMECG